MKDVIIIGAGNVGTHLALALKNAGYFIKQVFSRDMANAKCLADLVNAEAISEIEMIHTKAAYYIIAVSDAKITLIADDLPDVKGIVVHTAGSIPLSVLEKFSSHGVLYPFQTLTKDRSIEFTKVPILIEGNNKVVCNELNNLASSITGEVHPVDSEKRALLHIAAVFSSNFANHMYSISQQILEKSGLDFNILKPLITETAQKAISMNPIDAQTGPAKRKDFEIIGKHLEDLHDSKLIKEIYSTVSKSIVNTYYPGSPFFI